MLNCKHWHRAGVSAPGSGTIWADSKNGVFPTGAQFSGEVFAKTLGPKKKFPTDFDVYDINGNPIDLGKLVHGKNISSHICVIK